MKKKITKIIATMLCVIIVCSPLTTLAASKNRMGDMVKEVFVSTASSEKKAKKYLTDNGYKYVDLNVNEKTNTNKYVYIGYKTTSDPTEAITDLEIMNMNGGYSQTNYEDLIKNKKSLIKEDVKDLRVVINEFRKNYKAGEPMAKQAYENLNKFQDKKEDSSANLKCDDGKTDMLMGDYFLDENITDDQIATVFLQGNAKLFESLYQNLAFGIFKKSDKTVIEKFAAVDLDGNFSNENDKTAKVLASYMSDLVKKLKEYEESDIKLDDDEDEVNKYLESTDNDKKLDLIKYGTLYKMLESVEFGDGTMLDYFMENENARTKDMYPLASVLTPAQAIILPHIGLETLLVIKASNESAKNISIDKQLKSLNTNAEDIKPVSMYEGVDQNLFGGNVALTSYALMQSLATGDSPWYRGNASASFEIAMYTFAGVSLAAAVVTGITYCVKSAQISSFYAKADDAYNLIQAFEKSIYRFNYDWRGFLEGFENSVEHSSKAQELFINTYNNLLNKLNNVQNYYNSVPEMEASLPNASPWGTASLVATGLLLIASGVYLGVELYNYYHPEYKQIPDIMCNEVIDSSDKNATPQYVYYYAAKQHYDGDTKGEYGEYGDLNGFTGKQWLALYSTKDSSAGKPILSTDFLARGTDQYGLIYSGFLGQFNQYIGYNLNSHQYTDKSGGIYLQYRTYYTYEPDNTTASVFTSGKVALFAGIGVAVGLIIGSTVTFFALKNKKKKKEETTQTTE